MSKRSERLRKARQDAGYSTATAAAEAFGWNLSAYTHHENGTRSFGVEAAQKYARAFRVQIPYLLDIEKKTDSGKSAQFVVAVSVIGEVVAGVFREATQWPGEEQYEVSLPVIPFEGIRRFGLRVVGDSMNLIFPEGTILDCLSIYDLNAVPTNGDIVIVEVTAASGLREQAVKEYRVDDSGVHWLLPRSDKPEFQAPVRIGQPDVEQDIGPRIEVTALVIGSYAPINPRFFPARAVH